MNLTDIANRATPPEPWREGDNIPWNEPGFSQRMLKEHLSQDHDLASRRLATIDRHVAWIHATLLGGRPGGRVLDLGCGPGLYGERLALLGHAYTGIDFSPASIAYAQNVARQRNLACTYRLGDLRGVDFGPDEQFDLVMQIFGEMNTFRPSQARAILNKAFATLKPGGWVLLEASSEAALRGRGPAGAGWYSSLGGLFSDRPHLVLEETYWDESRKTLTSRFYVIDAPTGHVDRFAASYQAYTPDEYRTLLTGSGFTGVTLLPGVGDEPAGEPGSAPSEFLAILAQKPQP